MGKIGEELALCFLYRKGFRLVAQNWRCPLGELDIVLRQGGELVFVEVKTRLGDGKYVFDSVHWKKQRRLVNLTESYLRAHFRSGHRPPCRIDIVGVVISRTERFAKVDFQHLIAAL